MRAQGLRRLRQIYTKCKSFQRVHLTFPCTVSKSFSLPSASAGGKNVFKVTDFSFNTCIIFIAELTSHVLLLFLQLMQLFFFLPD